MGRIRTIKPEFPQSESIGRLSRDARLLFVQLWTICDDEGRARASSRLLASLLYPYDKDASDLIEGWLKELEAQDCIIRYEHDGNRYLQVCKWLTHQKIDHPGKSRIPAFDESSRKLAKARETLAPDLGPRTLDLGPRSIGPGSESADAPPLPDWIPSDAWSGFIEMRKKSRKALTNRAVILIVNELEKLRTQGQDIGAVLDQSTRNNWQDVYPVKETRSNGNGNGKGSTREVYERERAIIDARTQ